MKVRRTIYRVEGVFDEVIFNLVRRVWIRIYSGLRAEMRA